MIQSYVECPSWTKSPFRIVLEEINTKPKNKTTTINITTTTKTPNNPKESLKNLLLLGKIIFRANITYLNQKAWWQAVETYSCRKGMEWCLVGTHKVDVKAGDGRCRKG